jgi:hypothetical protein
MVDTLCACRRVNELQIANDWRCSGAIKNFAAVQLTTYRIRTSGSQIGIRLDDAPHANFATKSHTTLALGCAQQKCAFVRSGNNKEDPEKPNERSHRRSISSRGPLTWTDAVGQRSPNLGMLTSSDKLQTCPAFVCRRRFQIGLVRQRLACRSCTGVIPAASAIALARAQKLLHIFAHHVTVDVPGYGTASRVSQ